MLSIGPLAVPPIMLLKNMFSIMSDASFAKTGSVNTLADLAVDNTRLFKLYLTRSSPSILSRVLGSTIPASTLD